MAQDVRKGLPTTDPGDGECPAALADRVDAELNRFADECDAFLPRESLARLRAGLVRLVYELQRQRLTIDDDGFRANRLALVLSGQLDDLGVFDYDLQQHHVAIVTDSIAALGTLALATGCQRLRVVRPGNLVHGWFGGREPLDAETFELLAAERRLSEARIALGEPGFGADGFRASHRQALEAWRIVRAGICRVARYSDFALPLALARDQTVARDFLARYLDRLEPPLREAAQAYLRAGHNASAAAAHLRRSRRTVERQLARVEDCLRRPITEVAGELSIGFQLAELATYEGWWEGPQGDPWDTQARLHASAPSSRHLSRR